MRRSLKTAVLSFVLLFAAGQVYAAAPQWKIDPAHSRIHFEVKHIFATVFGLFEDFEGTTHFDPDDLAASSFDFTVKVNSVNTNNRKRDGHLRSGDFFAVNDYPEMTFKSTRITHKQGDEYVVEGNLTVKDVTRNIVVPFTLLGVREHPFNPQEEVAGFEARFTIDRLAYHVGNGKFLKMGIVGRMVDIVISTEMTRRK
jgi:polyisoprenoid-binding protein YceI